MERGIQEKSTQDHEAFTTNVQGWGMEDCILTIYRDLQR